MSELPEFNLDFGDYCTIEQFRYSPKNEYYLYKIIGRLQSNTYVDVPVRADRKEVLHDKIIDVVRCICCGVSETEVLKFRVEDVLLPSASQWSTQSLRQRLEESTRKVSELEFWRAANTKTSDHMAGTVENQAQEIVVLKQRMAAAEKDAQKDKTLLSDVHNMLKMAWDKREIAAIYFPTEIAIRLREAIAAEGAGEKL